MTSSPTRTAALYLRVSTAAQAGDERFGLAVQTRAAQQYAQLHGLQIVRTFQDVITGTRATRQELDTLLNVAHQYDAVLVSAVDRLARRTAIAYAVLEELLETGAEVHSADMGLIDPKDEMSSMNFGVRSVFAQSEHMRIAKRLRGGMLAKVREAGRPVIPPSGYGWHKGEIQEEEAQWIRQIYTWAREGQSAHAITTELNRLGAPRRGARWSESSVKYILANPLHKGQYVFGRARKGRGDGRDLVTCTVPAIIPPADWDATQRVIQGRRRGGRPGTRTDAHEFPLAKRLHCGQCGGTLSAVTNEPGPSRPTQRTTQRFYHCYRIYRRDGSRGELCTHRRYYNARTIHPFILDQLRALLTDDAALMAALDVPTPQPLDVTPAIAAIDKRLKNLKLLALDGGLSPTEYKETRQELEAQRDALTAPPNVPLQPNNLTQARDRLAQVLEGDDLADMARTLDLHVTLHPDGRTDLKLAAL